MTVNLANGKRVSVSAHSNGEIRLELWADRSGKGVILTAKEAIRIRSSLLAAILEVEKHQ